MRAIMQVDFGDFSCWHFEVTKMSLSEIDARRIEGGVGLPALTMSEGQCGQRASCANAA